MLKRLALGLGLLAATALAAPQARAEDPHAAPIHKAAGEAAGEAKAAGEATAAHAGAGAAADHEKEGLLDFHPDRVIWTIIIFVVMLAILYPTAWKNILAGLKQREERIRKDIADAQAASDKAQATLKEYQAQLATAENKVRELIGAAAAQGEKLAADIRAKAQQEAELSKSNATREIEAARKQALSEIYAAAAEISTSIAEKILRRNINVDDQRELVNSSLRELESSAGR